MHTTEQLNTALAGKYTIERRIGAGGMAVVYLARDLRHNRHVALKVLNPELGAVLGSERFMAEIQVTANLHHPNLLPLFDSGEAGGLLFYAMPYVEGETLRQRLERERQLGVDEAVRLATAMAGALDYAHRHNVIHRDLKPENVLLHEGQPLVMDFGIALAVSKAGGARITQTGLSLGTPQYMSPEQATGDHVLDARSDIYSLGAVLYEMLAGDPPHTGSTVQAVIAKVITEQPGSIRATRPTVPEHVESALMMSLAKVPADRFATAADFASALSGTRHVAALPTIARTTQSRRRARSEIMAWCVAGASLLSAATAALWPRPRVNDTAGRFTIALPDSTSLEGNGTSHARIAISRDGSSVVLGVQAGNAPTMLYLRRASDPVPIPIRGTEGGYSPTFSPSGDAIVFATKAGLRRVPITGGTPQKLGAASDSSVTYSSWSDDDQILYQSPGGSRLMMVSANGGESRLVAQPDTTKRIFQLRQPEFLPGGKYALVSFQRGARTANAAPDSLRLGVVSLADGSLTDLGVPGAEPHYVSGYVLFNRQSMVLAAPFSLRTRSFTGVPVRVLEGVAGVNPVTADYAVSRNGWLVYQSGAGATNAPTLWVVDMHGAGHPLATEDKPIVSFAASPDGKQLALEVRPQRTGDIWTMDLASGAMRLLSPNGGARPAWSRDGTRIYTVKDHGDALAWRMADGTGAESTFVIGKTIASFQPGPAHGWSVYRTASSGRPNLLIAPTDSLLALRTFVKRESGELGPAISPNGRWVAYMTDATGRMETVVRALPGPGPEFTVSIGGGEDPHWSPDGKTIYYRGPRHMIAAHVIEQPQFAVAKRDTLFVDTFSRGPSGVPSLLPNGKEFIMVRRTTEKPELYMVVNWPQLIAAPGAGKSVEH